MTTATLTPADILNQAASLIEAKGLNKGDYENSDTGCMCTMGAIIAAGAGAASYLQARDVKRDALVRQDTRRAAEAMRKHLTGEGVEREYLDSDGLVWIPNWNDAPERTTEDVADALRDAAKAVAA